MAVQAEDSCLVHATHAIPSSETGLDRRVKSIVQNFGAVVVNDSFERVREFRCISIRPSNILHIAYWLDTLGSHKQSTSSIQSTSVASSQDS